MQFPDLPDFLRIPQDQRHTAWAGRPLTSTPFIPLRRDEAPEARAMRERLKAEELIALKNRLARSKSRKETRAIDYGRMRWDPRRGKFVEDTGVRPKNDQQQIDKAVKVYELTRPFAEKLVDNWDKEFSKELPSVTKDTARALAELNGVWDDKYARLSGGLLVMTVTNRLKGLVKKGGVIRWN